MQNSFSNMATDINNFGLREAIAKYKKYIPLLIFFILLSLFAAWAYLRYTTKTYSATGALLIKSGGNNNLDQDKFSSLFSQSSMSEDLQNEIEIIKSIPVLTRVVEKMNLNFAYFIKGKIKKQLNIYKACPFVIEAFQIKDSAAAFTTEVRFVNKTKFTLGNNTKSYMLGETISNEWGVFMLKNNINRSPAINIPYQISWQPSEQVAEQMAGGIKVLPKIVGSSILSISQESENARLAADFVNQIMLQYDSILIEEGNITNNSMLDFITQSLQSLKPEIDYLKQNEETLQQKYQVYNIEQISQLNYALINEADKQIEEAQMKYENTSLITKYLSDKKNQYNNVSPAALEINDPQLMSLMQGYNLAQLDRIKLIKSNIGLNNSLVLAADATIESYRSKILETLENIKTATRKNIETVKTKQQAKIIKENQLTNSMPAYLIQLGENKRQLNTKLTLYSMLEEKKLEISLSKASKKSNLKIIQKAKQNNIPLKPNSKTILIIALFFSLAIPACIIIINELLNDKVNSKQDITKATQTPILGEINHTKTPNTLVVSKNSRKVVAEQFRILRSNLQYITNKISKPIIAITSTFSGEGKSFISTNMAAAIALSGKKTILLEFDIRKPNVLAGLKMNNLPGITNYLLGNADLEKLIVKIPDVENLYVLPCGPIPPNPADLLLDTKVEELFKALQNQFDTIIVDTAPVGLVSDTLTIGKYINCSLYVVRQGYTFKKQLAIVNDLYQNNKLPKMAIVVNDVKPQSGYGGYGGQYGEKSTYFDQEENKSFLSKLLFFITPKNWFK